MLNEENEYEKMKEHFDMISIYNDVHSKIFSKTQFKIVNIELDITNWRMRELKIPVNCWIIKNCAGLKNIRKENANSAIVLEKTHNFIHQ